MWSVIKETSLVRHSGVLMATVFLTGILGYMFHAVVARRMSVDQYGELQSLLALFNIVVVFTGWLSYYGVRYAAVFAAAGDKISSGQFWRWLDRKVLIWTICLGGVFVGASPVVGSYLRVNNWWGLFVVGLAGALWFMTLSSVGVLTGWESFLLIGGVNTVGSLVKLLAGIGLVAINTQAAVVSSSFLISSVVVWLLFRYICKRKFIDGEEVASSVRWRETYFRGRHIGHGKIFVVLFAWLMAVLFSIDLLVVRHLLPAYLTGQYGALSLLGKTAMWANLTVVTAVLPQVLARGYDGKKIDHNTLSLVYGLLLGIGGVTVTIYYWFGSLVLRILLGGQYVALAGDLWLFAVMAAGFSLLHLEANFAFARDDWRILLVLLVVIVLIIWGINIYHESIKQAAISIIVALVVGYVGAFVLNVHNRKLRIDGML